MLPKHVLHGVAAFAVFALPACSGGTSAASVPSAGPGVSGSQGAQRSAQSLRAFAADCSWSGTVTGVGNCSNIRLSGMTYGATTPAQLVPGLHPADLQAAYALPSTTAGTGQTIAIVVPFDNPNVEADLAVYRSTFGLPACTTANHCLSIHAPKKVPANANWSREMSIDVDMASAACPNCKLLIVEAKNDLDTDLSSALSSAVASHANVVSNSYVVPESPLENSAMWSHTGMPIVAAAGDQGSGIVNWPAASSSVIAVGATALMRDGTTSRGWTETAWAGSGNGCSTIALKPAWQTDTQCTKRMVADVVAVGDPATPVAVYDTYQDAGWLLMGGSSVATPIIAGAYALAGNGAHINAASSLYANRSALFSISGGHSASTGLGSPNGIGAF